MKSSPTTAIRSRRRHLQVRRAREQTQAQGDLRGIGHWPMHESLVLVALRTAGQRSTKVNKALLLSPLKKLVGLSNRVLLEYQTSTTIR
jgi:hypothetical protein